MARKTSSVFCVLVFAAASLGCGAFVDDSCESCTCETTADCGADEVCLDGVCVNNFEPAPGAGEVVCTIDEVAPGSLMDTCFSRIQSGQLADNLRGFAPRFPMYSNDTSKRRWIYIPPGTQVDGADADAWVFPKGTILWQEISTEHAVRIETRMLEKVGDGVGVNAWRPSVYLWTADDTDAHHSEDGRGPMAGTDYVIESLVGYGAPDTGTCSGCHQSSADTVLGFSAIQLTSESSPVPHQQWIERGYLASAGEPIEIVGPIVDQRMLGYLHANCGTCHSERGSQAQLGMFLDYDVAKSVDFESTNFFDTAVYKNLRVTPGNVQASGVYTRFIDGSMPPSAVTSRIDPEYREYFSPWIQLMEAGTAVPAVAPLSIDADNPAGIAQLGYDEIQVDLAEGQVFERSEPLPIRSRAFLVVDPQATYRVRGRFRSTGAVDSVVSLGLAPYDASGRPIQSYQSNRAGNAVTLDLSATTSTALATTASVSTWSQPPAAGWDRYVGFYFDGDTGHLPDFVLVGPGESSTSATAGAYSSASGNLVSLNTPLPQSVLASLTPNTVIMNHREAEPYLWAAAWNASVGGAWVELSGTISGQDFNGGVGIFRPGTAFVKLQLAANNNQAGQNTTLLFDRLEVELVP